MQGGIPVEGRPSPIHGNGAFATRPIIDVNDHVAMRQGWLLMQIARRTDFTPRDIKGVHQR